MNLRKEKKITDRDRPSIKNQGQTFKKLPKISTKKKKKKISQIQTPIPCSENLTNLHINPPNLHMHIHTEREREKDRVYEMNGGFDMFDES